MDVWLRGVRGTSATGDSNGREGQCVCLSGDPKVVESGEEKVVTCWVLQPAVRLLREARVPAAAGVGGTLRQLSREGAGMTEEAAVPDPPTPSVTAHRGPDQRL